MTKNLILEYNTITTRNDNVYQLDCIKIGGLGTGNAVTQDETMIIRYNTLKNSSTYSSGHCDCIQFYTNIKALSENSLSGLKRYYYGSSKYQIVQIYGNYIEQVSSNHPGNNGIIVGGCADDRENEQDLYEYSANYMQQGYFDLNFQQGKMTKWYIWSNIFRHAEGRNLINFNNLDPEEIQIFNNTFYQAANTTNPGSLFVIYNMWNSTGNKLDGTNNAKSILRNFKLRNNIFYTNASAQYGRLLKFGQYKIGNPSNIYNNIYAFIDFASTDSIDYNWYYKAGTDNTIVEKYASNQLTTYTFNNGWSSYDSHGGNSNPEFITNPPTHASHFELYWSQINYLCSPCMDKGIAINIPEINEEAGSFEGETRGIDGPWDIGAYEDDINESIQRNPSENVSIFAYPNPFNPITTIEYIVPADGNVTLKVYDILGNEVNTLSDEFKKAGKYSVSLYGENLSSGIYFCVLKTKDYNRIKKLMLLK